MPCKWRRIPEILHRICVYAQIDLPRFFLYVGPCKFIQPSYKGVFILRAVTFTVGGSAVEQVMGDVI